VLLAALLASCTGSVHVPSELRTPSVVGVVEGFVRQPDGRDRYELLNGQSLEIDYDETENLLGGPEVGWLLLFGTDPDGGQWIAGVSLSTTLGRPTGCFLHPAQGRAVDGWIETSSGFRLPKAAGFRDPRDHPTDLFSSDRGTFCLNERGEVTSYDVI
jgi:hypothetical protein